MPVRHATVVRDAEDADRPVALPGRPTTMDAGVLARSSGRGLVDSTHSVRSQRDSHGPGVATPAAS